MKNSTLWCIYPSMPPMAFLNRKTINYMQSSIAKCIVLVTVFLIDFGLCFIYGLVDLSPVGGRHTIQCIAQCL